MILRHGVIKAGIAFLCMSIAAAQDFDRVDFGKTPPPAEVGVPGAANFGADDAEPGPPPAAPTEAVQPPPFAPIQPVPPFRLPIPTLSPPSTIYPSATIYPPSTRQQPAQLVPTTAQQPYRWHRTTQMAMPSPGDTFESREGRDSEQLPIASEALSTAEQSTPGRVLTTTLPTHPRSTKTLWVLPSEASPNSTSTSLPQVSVIPTSIGPGVRTSARPTKSMASRGLAISTIFSFLAGSAFAAMVLA